MQPLILFPLLFALVSLLFHRLLQKSRSTIPTWNTFSAFSSLPILAVSLIGRRNATIHSAHIRHGPIVRLSPTEISISSPNALTTVYTSFPKHSWYNIFRNYGVAPMFAMLPGREHAARKKLLAAAYSNSAIVKSELLKRVAAETLPVLLGGFAEGEGGVEVWEVFNRLAMDFVTAFLFTRELGSRFLDGESLEILRLYHSRRAFFALSSELPWVAGWVVPRWVDDANEKLEAWCRRLCAARRRQWEEGAEECIIDRLISAGLSEMEAASEMLDHIGAGHETTALTLSFTLSVLSSRPELQRELRRSLEPLMEERDGWKLPRMSGDGLEDHGLLNAVIKEALRLYAPIPGSQPRVVPRDMEIMGHGVPAGTVVSAQAWTLHRDPKLWGEDVEEFLPERWVDGEKTEMARAWWAFGSGGRGCIGRWLALWELRAVLATLYANFETESSSAEIADAYTTAPVGGKVEVIFKRV